MTSLWKWILGGTAVLVVLGILSMPIMMGLFGGYGMMQGGQYGWRMPMMGYGGWGPGVPMMGGFGMLGFGMLFSGLIQLGVLVLIVLGIVWLVRAIRRQDQTGK